MPLTIIDSTVLIDVLRGREPAIRFLSESAESGPLSSSVVVRAELWRGASPAQNDAVRELVDRFRWLDVTGPIADLAGRLGHQFGLTHRIGLADLVLAATAIELGGTVATSNIRHFPMFPGLQPPY